MKEAKFLLFLLSESIYFRNLKCKTENRMKKQGTYRKVVFEINEKKRFFSMRKREALGRGIEIIWGLLANCFGRISLPTAEGLLCVRNAELFKFGLV